MCGSATLTMVASNTTISCAVARTGRAKPGRRAPAPSGAAARVVWDRVSGMRVLLGVLVSTWRWPARREQRLSAAEAIQEFECEMDAQCFAGVDEHKDHAAAARAARD